MKKRLPPTIKRFSRIQRTSFYIFSGQTCSNICTAMMKLWLSMTKRSSLPLILLWESIVFSGKELPGGQGTQVCGSRQQAKRSKIGRAHV